MGSGKEHRVADLVGRGVQAAGVGVPLVLGKGLLDLGLGGFVKFVDVFDGGS